MVIGITINNLLRNHIPQVIKAYEEIIGSNPIEPINPFDMELSFPTVKTNKNIKEFVVNEEGDTSEEMHEFTDSDKDFDVYELMYMDASFEIFGRAEETINGLLFKLKQFEREAKIELALLNKESPRSKCATLFFLSKNNFNFKKVIFPDRETEFWKYVDVLITDNPKILKGKQARKISIKVQNEFNLDIESDYSIIDLNNIDELKKIIKKIKAKKRKINGKFRKHNK